MTDEMMSLRGLIEKTRDADLLREMIGFAAIGLCPIPRRDVSGADRRLMELEVGELAGAAYGEKDPERLAQRNGYRERGLEPGPAPWSCGSPNSGKAVTFRAFSSRGVCQLR